MNEDYIRAYVTVFGLINFSIYFAVLVGYYWKGPEFIIKYMKYVIFYNKGFNVLFAYQSIVFLSIAVLLIY